MMIFPRRTARISVNDARSRTDVARRDTALPVARGACGREADRTACAVNLNGGTNAWAAAGSPVADERGNSGSIP